MAYLACLVYVGIIYIRPGEIIPGWLGFPFLQIAGVIVALSAVLSFVLEPRKFANLPNDRSFLGFCLAIILSRPSTGWFGGGYLALLSILPLVMFYLSIRLAVRSERQLRGLVAAVILFTLFQAGNGIVQYHTGMGLGGSTAHVRVEYDPDTGEEIEEVKRIRGTGIFDDPNDLAMSLVVVLPFLFSTVLSGGSGVTKRLLATGAIGVIGYAFVLTQSRGGFVGLAALSAVYAYRRFGRITAVVVGIAVVAGMLATGPSRFRQMDTAESSAQGRIQSWSAGLQMFKSKPVLGVGYGGFGDYNRLTAHNSYIHAFAELGTVGGYFFVGICYFFLIATSAIRDVAGASRSRLARDILASGVGVMACALFLSRLYSPVFHVPLVLGAARVAITPGEHQTTPFHRGSDWFVVLGLSVGVILGTYFVVVALARWSGA